MPLEVAPEMLPEPDAMVDEFMPEDSPAELARTRLRELLELLTGQGLSQQEIAGQAGLPAQYLSDIKHGRRRMTELVARRLAAQFDINHDWLMGASQLRAPSQTTGPSDDFWLPLFPHPIQGEPRAHPQWTGSSVELPGVAFAQLVLATRPYVLQFGHDDMRGRLRRGDLVLISQAPSKGAEIFVVGYRKKLFLARRRDNGEWERVANGDRLPASCPVAGHALGIVWGRLNREPDSREGSY